MVQNKVTRFMAYGIDRTLTILTCCFTISPMLFDSLITILYDVLFNVYFAVKVTESLY